MSWPLQDEAKPLRAGAHQGGGATPAWLQSAALEQRFFGKMPAPARFQPAPRRLVGKWLMANMHAPPAGPMGPPIGSWDSSSRARHLQLQLPASCRPGRSTPGSRRLGRMAGTKAIAFELSRGGAAGSWGEGEANAVLLCCCGFWQCLCRSDDAFSLTNRRQRRSLGLRRGTVSAIAPRSSAPWRHFHGQGCGRIGPRGACAALRLAESLPGDGSAPFQERRTLPQPVHSRRAA